MLQRIQFNQRTQNTNNSMAVASKREKISFKAIEKTLLGIKPDAFEKGIDGVILKEILEKTGFKLLAENVKVQPRATMERHYAEHAQKGFFDSLISYVTRDKFGAYKLEGDNAVATLRKAASEIREKYAPGAKTENLVHSSDSVESANREIANFFSANA